VVVVAPAVEVDVAERGFFGHWTVGRLEGWKVGRWFRDEAMRIETAVSMPYIRAVFSTTFMQLAVEH
jgi:hypothetical protein